MFGSFRLACRARSWWCRVGVGRVHLFGLFVSDLVGEFAYVGVGDELVLCLVEAFARLCAGVLIVSQVVCCGLRA